MPIENTCPSQTFSLTATREVPGTNVSGTASGFAIPVGAVQSTWEFTDLGSDGSYSYCRFELIDFEGHQLLGTTGAVSSGGTATFSFPVDIPAGAVTAKFNFGTSGGTELLVCAESVTVNWIGPCEGLYCAYGAENNPDAQVYTYVTTSLLEIIGALVLTATGQLEILPYFVTAFSVILGAPLLAANCATLPTPVPTLDLTDLTRLNPTNALQWFQNAVWHFYCQCHAGPIGSPPPIPPPPPEIIVPPDLPPGSPTEPTQPQPPITCSNDDICTTLNHMTLTLGQMAGALGVIRVLLERLSAPLRLRPATARSGLTGSGQFAVSGIRGLAVELTTLPPGIGLTSDDPVIYHQAGWVSAGTADGWRTSLTISHNPMFIPVDAVDTLIGWTLQTGVVARLVELEPY